MYSYYKKEFGTIRQTHLFGCQNIEPVLLQGEPPGFALCHKQCHVCQNLSFCTRALTRVMQVGVSHIECKVCMQSSTKSMRTCAAKLEKHA
jgi:hypothetical protein